MPDPQQVVDALRSAYSAWGYRIVLLGALLENTALLGLVLFRLADRRAAGWRGREL